MEMHPLQARIGNPQIKVERLKDPEHTSRITVQPLPSGFGQTLGNSLRRVLLSSLSGAAVVAIKFKGASHEFTAIKGLQESLIDIILNLKELRITKTTEDDVTLKLEIKNKTGLITAKEIKESAGVKIINKNAPLFNIDDKKTVIEMELLIRTGVGYSPSTEREKLSQGMVAVDAIFTPVRTVSYQVDPARVGGFTELDKLTMDVTTDGSLDSHDAIQNSSDILKFYFGLFHKATDKSVDELVADTETDPAKQPKEEAVEEELYTPIEILALSPRTLNALINGNITSVEQLKKTPRKHLAALKGFGKKAIDEVSAALASLDESSDQ